MVRKVSFGEAKQILDTRSGCIMLDVREEEEYITGHAVDAVLLPVDELDANSAAEAIGSRQTPILVYCRSGYRSKIAAEKLAELGYTEIYDVGSLIGWPYGLE